MNNAESSIIQIQLKLNKSITLMEKLVKYNFYLIQIANRKYYALHTNKNKNLQIFNAFQIS